VQRVLRAYPDTITMDIHCAPIGLWTSLSDKNFAKICRIRINPSDVLDSESVVINEFVGEYIAVFNTTQFLVIFWDISLAFHLPDDVLLALNKYSDKFLL
jgi:hypothetical protein